MNSYNRRNDGPSKVEGRDNFQTIHPSLEVVILLGAPSKDCQFYGICRIEPTDQWREARTSLPDNGVFAILQQDDTSGVLRIQFLLENMTALVHQKYFETDFFQILERVELPDFVSRFFGVSYTVTEGNYPLKKDETFYEIILGTTEKL